MRVFSTIICLCTFLLSSVAQATEITISAGAPSLKWEWGKETVVTIPVTAANGPVLATSRVKIQYDSRLLKFTGVDKGLTLKSGSALSGFTLNEPGLLTVNFSSIKGINGSGNLFLLKFHVIPSGITGHSSSIQIESPLTTRADNETDIAVESVNGEINLLWQILALPLEWLAGGAVGLLVLFCLVIRMFRKKKPENKSPQQNAGNQSSQAKPAEKDKAAATKFCTKCGSSIKPDQKFCGECGSPVNG